MLFIAITLFIFSKIIGFGFSFEVSALVTARIMGVAVFGGLYLFLRWINNSAIFPVWPLMIAALCWSFYPALGEIFCGVGSFASASCLDSFFLSDFAQWVYLVLIIGSGYYIVFK